MSEYGAVTRIVRRTSLRSHSAFVNLRDGSPALSPACLDVLLTLEDGPLDRRSISRTSGKAMSTVHNCLLKLESAGLIVERDQQVGLLATNIELGLDKWVTAMDLGDRTDARRQRHARDRLSLKRLLAGRSDTEMWVAERASCRRGAVHREFKFGRPASQSPELLQARAAREQLRRSMRLGVIG